MATHVSGSVKKVSQGILGVSEPNPSMFGNAPNPTSHQGWTNKNWLKSRFHFSFAEYYNPANQNFGVLRVMNDDLVQPERGFGTHGHRDAEICTYVVQGNLTHKDSMGTSETLGPGSVQFMTAGSGIHHSEHNLGKKPLRFVQIWLTPRRRGLTPQYGSYPGDAAKRANSWHHLVSDAANKSQKTPVSVQTDANIFVAENSGSSSLELEVREGRQAYLLCIDGSTNIKDSETNVCPESGINLDRHDAAEIVGPAKLVLDGKSELLLVEMAKDDSSCGRGDI